MRSQNLPRAWEVDGLNPGRVTPVFDNGRVAFLLDAEYFKEWNTDKQTWLAIIAQALMSLMASSCVEVPCKGTFIVIMSHLRW